MITIDDLPEEGGIYAKTKLEWKEVDHLYIHYFYKITNNINGKFYYGIHSILKEDPASNDLVNDGYWGSGTAIHEAEVKYGLENFTKTIEATFSTRAEVRLREAEIVTQELVDDRMCYNMVLGGCESPKWQGGWVLVNYADKSSRKDKMFSIPSEEYYDNKDKYITTGSGFINVNFRDPKKRLEKYFSISTEEYNNNKDTYITPFMNLVAYKNKDDWSDIRRLSPDDPLVMSGQFIGINNGVRQDQETINKKTGEKNGSYGTIWITNGAENKKIGKNTEIPPGWKKGRITEVPVINIITSEIKYVLTKDSDDFLKSNPNWCLKILVDRSGKIITLPKLLELGKTYNRKQICKLLGKDDMTLKKIGRYYGEDDILGVLSELYKDERDKKLSPMKRSRGKRTRKSVWIEHSTGKKILVKKEIVSSYLQSGWSTVKSSLSEYNITDKLREEIISTFVETLSIKETSKRTKVSRKFIRENILKINETSQLRRFKNKSGVIHRTFIPENKEILERISSYGWILTKHVDRTSR